MAQEPWGVMRILLVQTGFLGDVVLSTPLIAAIKERHPGSELWMLVTPQAVDLVKDDPLLAGVLYFDKRGRDRGLIGLCRFAGVLKEQGFDIAYTLHRSYRTALMLWLARIPLRIGFSQAAFSFLYHRRVDRPRQVHEVRRNLALLREAAGGLEYKDELRVFTEEQLPRAPEIEGLLGCAGGYVVVAPGSVWATKRWSAAGYRRVVEYLIAQGERVVLLGSREEAATARQVGEGLCVFDLVGRISLADSMKIVKQAKAVICNDSLVLHLASAFKIPTVVVFCATSPAFGFGPWKNRAEIVERRDLPCKPCRRHGGHRCPSGTEECMRGLSASEVIAAFERIVRWR